MASFISIGVFGILGVFARYFCNVLSLHFFENTAVATLFVNIVGSTLIGLFFVLAMEKGQLTESLYIGLAVGLLGGFTTFSGFSLDFVRLFNSGEWMKGFAYALLSPVLGILFCFGGMALGRKFF